MIFIFVFICITGVETLLCYLELHPQRFVELLHPTLSVCKVSCYDGPRQLQRITKMYELLSFQATLILISSSYLIRFISFSFFLFYKIKPAAALRLPWCWPDGGWLASAWRRVISWSLTSWRLQTPWDGSFLL